MKAQFTRILEHEVEDEVEDKDESKKLIGTTKQTPQFSSAPSKFNVLLAYISPTNLVLKTRHVLL